MPWSCRRALGLGDDRGLDPVERIAGYLANRRALLLVDNCEHVLGPAARAVDPPAALLPRGFRARHQP